MSGLRGISLLFFFGLTLSILQASTVIQAPRVSAQEARHYVGRQATVCGAVASATHDRSSREQPTSIYLEKPSPDHLFSIVIRQKDRAEFGDPEVVYRNKRICITGKVETFSGKPRIVAAYPKQIEVVSDVPLDLDSTAQEAPLSDAAIRKILIRRSLAGYSGSCPCPYSRDRAGRRCGRRSAYSRPGGASPLCFDHDITPRMIESYRKNKE